MTQKTNPALVATSEPGYEPSVAFDRIRTPRKWERVLSAFAEGKSYNRFEAERDLHDHCLHSTVSALQGKGIRIDRRHETVPGYLGIPTDVCRYWLPPESVRAAADLLRQAQPGARSSAQEAA